MSNSNEVIKSQKFSRREILKSFLSLGVGILTGFPNVTKPNDNESLETNYETIRNFSLDPSLPFIMFTFSNDSIAHIANNEDMSLDPNVKIKTPSGTLISLKDLIHLNSLKVTVYSPDSNLVVHNGINSEIKILKTDGKASLFQFDSNQLATPGGLFRVVSQKGLQNENDKGTIDQKEYLPIFENLKAGNYSLYQVVNGTLLLPNSIADQNSESQSQFPSTIIYIDGKISYAAHSLSPLSEFVLFKDNYHDLINTGRMSVFILNGKTRYIVNDSGNNPRFIQPDDKNNIISFKPLPGGSSSGFSIFTETLIRAVIHSKFFLQINTQAPGQQETNIELISMYDSFMESWLGNPKNEAEALTALDLQFNNANSSKES